MSLRYHLDENPVKKTRFRAILSRGKKTGLQEFLDFCEKKSSVSAADARTVVELMADWVVENARKGREADFGPVGQSRLGLKGDFDVQGDWVQEAGMRLTAGWQVSRDLARRVREAGDKAKKVRIRQKSKKPKIDEVRSAASKKKNVYTPGNILEIRGVYLKFDPKRSDEGVFLRQKKGASETRLKFYQTVYPKKIVALVPEDLSGTREILVRCRPRPKGPVQEHLFPHALRSTKK